MHICKNVLDFLDNALDKNPDKVAFADESSSITFAELQKITDSIGTALAKRVSSKRQPIAVSINRGSSSICCFMGIVASGNFYVPLDTTQPVNRVATILDQMDPVAVIGIGEAFSEECATAINNRGILLLDYASLAATTPDQSLLRSIRANTLDTDPLYAICTSGSTGTPKGVLVSHRSVLDFIPVFADTLDLASDDVFGNQAPFDFDVSVKDIYSTLYLNATMHIIPRRCFSMPKLLGPFLEERGVTTLIWAVSALCVVSGFNSFKAGAPSSIRKVMFSGEAMPVKHLNVWRRYFPKATFVNLYGPTEVTCNCTYHIIDCEYSDDERLPLGKPFPNESVYVLGSDGGPITPGETGEIYVSGTCLALGYYNDPDRTATAFLQNPLNGKWPETVYKTGDLAELFEDGSYVFAGRSDFQIKHMGHRIELEEIELHLGAVEGVERACCMLDERRNKIVACYSGVAESRSIAIALSKKLPKYMVPSVYHNLDSLPITKNGKIDRALLKEEYAS